ncbi:MAG: hypothetical protein WC503_04090 [Candidatus Shapirobacteria bacterium]
MDDLKWLKEREEHIVEIRLLREDNFELKARVEELEGLISEDKCEITCLECNNKFSVQNGEEEVNWFCPVCKVNRRLTEAEGWLRQFNTCLSLQDMTKLLRAVHKFLLRDK